MHNRRQSGFTLIEVLIVLLVLGLVAGLVLTRGPQRSPTLELRAAAADVAQALRLARTRAIAENRRTVLTVDVADRSFGVDGAITRLLPPTLDIVVEAVSGQVVGGRRAGISFAPDGSSSGGRIGLAEGARRIEIGVDWLTGRVSVADAR